MRQPNGLRAAAIKTKPVFVAVGHENTPYVNIYPWLASGFGAKIANPATLLEIGPLNNGITFSPDGKFFAAATVYGIKVYNWSSSGFGSIVSPGTDTENYHIAVRFSPNGSYIAASLANSPYIGVWGWSESGFGSKFSNPGTLPTGQGYGVAFSPSSNAIVAAHLNTPYVTAYPWSGSGFGTKYTNPGTLPAWTCYSAAFAPNGAAVVFAHDFSPYVAAYAWSGSGFGTKYANPSSAVSNAGRDAVFSPDGANVAVAHARGFVGDNAIYVYSWSGSGFGTKYANPATLTDQDGRGVAFSPDGSAVAMATVNTPFVAAYQWSGSGFGTKYANPGTLPAGESGNCIAFSPL